MSLDLYIVKYGESLRCGYTTGSCATAAAKAAALMLDSQSPISYVEIDTPADVRLRLEVQNPVITKNHVYCGIIKDAGDDPDNTDGMEIRARVSKRKDGQIIIDGGEGIGRINRKGLFGQIGEAAINPVPREMIKKELEEVGETGYDVLIYAPAGKEVAKKTFNSIIGIEGGISIIGTKGIVYPMSDEALLKTIYMEIDAIEEKYGKDDIILVPGNYGEKMIDSLNLKGPLVKMSNYIGQSLLYVYKKGFKSVTLLGHIGKFAKLSIGAFQTHSKICDARMEAFVYYLALMGADEKTIYKVDEALTAEEALNICIESGYGKIVKLMEKGSVKRIKRYLKDDDFNVSVIIYSMERGVDIC